MAQVLANAKAQILELMRRYRHRVDFLSIRLENSQSSQILLRGQQPEMLSETSEVGGQVRACYRGGWGFVSFNRIDALAPYVEEAIAAARILGTTRTRLAAVEPVQFHQPLTIPGKNPREVSIGQKQILCDRYAQIMRDYSPLITGTAVRYGDSLQRVILINSEGTVLDHSWVDLEMRFAATARDSQSVQTGRETTGSRRGYCDLEHLDSMVKRAAQRAVNSLRLPTVKGGLYPIVIDPVLTGLFVHEAFGHLSEADMIYENPDLLEAMPLGHRFGPPDLNIYDGAALEGHRGSYLYDDEGVPATITPLIQNGILVGRLHSRETAGALGAKPTGNSRCLNYHFPPLVRMTNTWIGQGTTPSHSLMDGIQEGLYARNWRSGMTNGEMFTFSAGEAWRIRHGKLAEPVRDVTLSGNAFRTLANIEAIGDDLAWDESGGCGKGGQDGLAVGCGGPSLRIRDVIIGGT
ncbi:TldD/PmbA family protein [Lyngbya confervoides]|uniref:TldD/PmbA family protein n=1 Tax=Lyngbya confervoides BDU141951 TaxID=1574623 RepID=A0ABD4T620_9CYAN|nr:TldD/PmbA family protein [Lyngbya confervoides]MCM1983878.1 TldD/PmbA family protein [Lyngbya confervoides BDU141951]